MSELLDAIPDVDIDDNGTFKYILIHVFDGDKDDVKTILRGYLREFHEPDVQVINRTIRCPRVKLLGLDKTKFISTELLEYKC